jgi:hypothetical protein
MNMVVATRKPLTSSESSVIEKIRSVKANPQLAEASQQLASLRKEESQLLKTLQTEPDREDPHRHDQTREKLTAIRAKIGPAEVAMKKTEAEVLRDLTAAIEPVHAAVAESLQANLKGLIDDIGKLQEFRTQSGTAGSGFRYFGLDSLQMTRTQLQHILSLWTAR